MGISNTNTNSNPTSTKIDLKPETDSKESTALKINTQTEYGSTPTSNEITSFGSTNNDTEIIEITNATTHEHKELTRAQKAKLVTASIGGGVDSFLTSLAFLIAATIYESDAEENNESIFIMKSVFAMLLVLLGTAAGSWLRYFELAERAIGEEDQELTDEEEANRHQNARWAAAAVWMCAATEFLDGALAYKLIVTEVDSIPVFALATTLALTFGVFNAGRFLLSDALASFRVYAQHNPNIYQLTQQPGFRAFYAKSRMFARVLQELYPAFNGVLAGWSANQLLHELTDIDQYGFSLPVRIILETILAILSLVPGIGVQVYSRFFDIAQMMDCLNAGQEIEPLELENWLERHPNRFANILGKIQSGAFAIDLFELARCKNPERKAYLFATIGNFFGELALAVDAMQVYLFSKDAKAIKAGEQGVMPNYYMKDPNKVAAIGQGPKSCPKHLCGAESGERFFAMLPAYAVTSGEAGSAYKAMIAYRERDLRRRGYSTSTESSANTSEVTPILGPKSP